MNKFVTYEKATSRESAKHVARRWAHLFPGERFAVLLGDVTVKLAYHIGPGCNLATARRLGLTLMSVHIVSTKTGRLYEREHRSGQGGWRAPRPSHPAGEMEGLL